MGTDRVAPLAAAAVRKHEGAILRASAALRELDRAGAVINFQTVAQTAGVSRQWLYQQPDLRREIEQLRDPSGKPPGIPDAQRATETSLRQRVRTLLDENQRLRNETAELRGELELAYGQQRATRHAN